MITAKLFGRPSVGDTSALGDCETAQENQQQLANSVSAGSIEFAQFLIAGKRLSMIGNHNEVEHSESLRLYSADQSFTVQEIFGSKSFSDYANDEELCVVCLVETIDIVLIPCRYMHLSDICHTHLLFY